MDTSKASNFNLTVPRRAVYATAGLIPLLIFSAWQVKYFLLPGWTEIFDLDRKSLATLAVTARLFWVPVISYVLISGFFILGTLIFKPLKPWKELGLAMWLINGLIALVLVTLLFGVLQGLLFGSLHGLLIGLSLGPIVGLKVELEKD